MKNKTDDKTAALLLRKARKKFLSATLAAELVRQPSTLTRQYASTFACSSQLVIDNDYQMRSTFYCKRRWCQTCASINMAAMIDNYLEPLTAFDNLYFVTLTRRNVKSYEVENAISSMASTWRKITDLARKRGVVLDGVRKTELKVGKGGGYHPHYHILVNGYEAACYIVTQWLERSHGIASPKAQDIRKVDSVEAAVVELMKYATKLTCAEDSSNQVLCSPSQLNVIFQALHRKRLFQPFGRLKVSRSAEEEFKPEEQTIRKAEGLYEWIGHDWYHSLYGHALSNYVPDSDDMMIRRSYRSVEEDEIKRLTRRKSALQSVYKG